MASVRIHTAVADDLEPIVSIYNASIPGRLATADLEPVTVAERVAWFERHDVARPLWVARDEDEVVGWLSFEAFYGRPAYHRTVRSAFTSRLDISGEGSPAGCSKPPCGARPSSACRCCSGSCSATTLRA